MVKVPIVYVRVSDLARAWVGWGTLDNRPYIPHAGPAEMIHEKRKHEIAFTPQSAFLLKELDRFFSRFTGNILVKGIFDGVRAIHDTRTSRYVVSLVEFKTTEEYASETTIEMAAFQLQLYIWLLKPYLTRKGFKLHKRHYVEIVRRADGKFLERFRVKEDPAIEEKIWLLLAEHDGILAIQKAGT